MTKDPNREAKDVVKSMKADVMRDSMTTAGAAELLGVSPSTLRKWVRDGLAECKVIGGQLRFSREELRRLFREPRQGDGG